MTTTEKTVKFGGNVVGVSTGNAFAYFLLDYLTINEIYVPTDPVVAVAMGGAVLSVLLLEVKQMGRAIKYVFDRFFPPKEAKSEE